MPGHAEEAHRARRSRREEVLHLQDHANARAAAHQRRLRQDWEEVSGAKEEVNSINSE